MKTATLTLCLLLLVKNSHQRSSPNSLNYVAAVVEFSPTVATSPNEPPTRINAGRYVSFIEKAAKQNVDIIIFPESGLTTITLPGRRGLEAWTTIIPAPSANYNPCIHSTIPVIESLKVISCAARDNMLYVMINIAEKVICTNESCPSDKSFYYNTNVVFDREGKIISRYRKTNLFLEPGFNVTTIPEVVTFDTDFGVTFGTFICFDVLFKKPAMYLTRILNVTDIISPTAWFSEVPFLTALQTQAGWSYAEDVNFLVAGYDRPKFGNSGSGIYLGRQGIAKSIIPFTTTNEMLIAKVPKKDRSSSYQRARPRYEYSLEEANQPIDEEEHYIHDELRRKRSVKIENLEFTSETRKKRSNEFEEPTSLSILHEDLSSYKSYQFDKSVISRNFCDGDFCCNFNVEMTNQDQDSKYRLIVYDGTRTTAEPVNVGLRVCAIVRCSNDSIASCGNLEESSNIFNTLTINATYPNYEDVLVIPSSITHDLQPIDNWVYEERWDDKILHITANLDVPTKNIVTCGLYARDFTRDDSAIQSDSKIGMQWATLTALGIVTLFLVFLYRKGWRKPWQRDNQLSSDAGPYQNLQSR